MIKTCPICKETLARSLVPSFLTCRNNHLVQPMSSLCPVCRQEQFRTDSGVTCPNGHGGEVGVEADGSPSADPAFSLMPIQETPSPHVVFRPGGGREDWVVPTDIDPMMPEPPPLTMLSPSSKEGDTVWWRNKYGVHYMGNVSAIYQTVEVVVDAGDTHRLRIYPDGRVEPVAIFFAGQS